MNLNQPAPGIKDYISARLGKPDAEIPHISAAVDMAGALAVKGRPFWQALGALENSYWQDELASTPIKAPVYVCGLARSGTTILLETLAGTGAFSTHLYRDFPFVDIPVLWNRWLDCQPAVKTVPARERAHLDGLPVTPESPEALEEMLWMAAFPQSHNPDIPSVLDASTDKPSFERHYKSHIHKILWLRKKPRYLTKGNYHLTRMLYIQKLFPDARFIVPVREPVAHIASLVKQHLLFSTLEKEDPRVLRYMQRLGHFEFGLDRRPINCGDTDAAARVKNLWASGDEIGGWALYWSMIHNWIYEILESHPALRQAVLIVPFDHLHTRPDEAVRRLLDFCGFDVDEAALKILAARLHAPTYYRHDFDERALRAIRDATAQTWEKLSGAGEGT